MLRLIVVFALVIASGLSARAWSTLTERQTGIAAPQPAIVQPVKAAEKPVADRETSGQRPAETVPAAPRQAEKPAIATPAAEKSEPARRAVRHKAFTWHRDRPRTDYRSRYRAFDRIAAKARIRTFMMWLASRRR